MYKNYLLLISALFAVNALHGMQKNRDDEQLEQESPEIQLNEELYHSVRHKSDYEEVKRLIDAGAKPTFRFGDKKRTALIVESQKANCDPRIVGLLLKAGAAPYEADAWGGTPLEFCVWNENFNVEVLKLMVAATQFVDPRDCMKRTPLMRAAQMGNIVAARLLLEHKAYIDAQDAHGNTPLMYGVEFGKIDSVRFLLSMNAQKNIVNNSGQTAHALALQLFERKHDPIYQEIANLLK